jgi:hypothetical protein
MYFEIVKRILDTAIKRFGDKEGLSREEICRQMSAHLSEMSKQHRADAPAIPYDDPLCRLGYLYMHVAANATMFERALGLDAPQQVIRARAGGTLQVCSLGGGPGSELLGLTKFILGRYKPENYLPKRIEFTVVDVVPEWGETWTQLARQAESAFEASGLPPPVIVDRFYAVDASRGASYGKFAWLMSDIDLFVFNYFVSENLDHLDALAEALAVLATKAAKDAVFVFIDRRELTDRINRWLGEVLPRVGFGPVDDPKVVGGSLDGDEQASDLGDYLTLVGKNPRVKFFTPFWRQPTAFYLAARRSP